MKAGWLLLAPLFSPLFAENAAKFYFVDVGHGNAAFVTAPSGETMLLDAGPTRAADRILAFMDQNGIRKIDYLVISHFEDDHMGAARRMAPRTEIVNFVDHGTSVTYGKDDAWWKRHRGPWFREGMSKADDKNFDEYREARAKSRHLKVKAGDKIPVKGLDVDVVSAEGKVIAKPLVKGATAPAACATVDRRSEDDAEDGQSVGVTLRFGKFRFIYLGDLTWNTANSLFCPENKIGAVDAYLVTHHAQSMPSAMGDYYYGLSCCSAAEVHGLNPRVAFLSMGSLGHKAGTPAAMQVLREIHGLDLWQTEYIRDGGEKGFNGPEEYAANTGERSEKVPFIQMTAMADGSFSVTNSRNGVTKKYPVRK
ncbi:MAG TPA: MBL fold metallo-hydrolase [Bryobacteraceae bacterium]|nr:MBL fold metallo-hydrolase [Bryobacteraceae bacterium]